MIAALWALARRLAPAAAAPWLAALQAEAGYDSDRRRGRWLWAAFGCALRLRVRAHAATLAAAALVVATVAVDWRSGAVLPAMLLVAATAAVLAAGRCTAPGYATLLAGALLPAAHALAHLDRALWPWYQFAPFRPGDWGVLALLFVPAWIGARIGGAVRAFKPAAARL